MYDDIDNNANYIENYDSNIDADTNLADLDINRLNTLNENIKNSNIKFNDPNNPSLFPANNLIRATADNLAMAEALVDEKPLRTPKTAELEQKEMEEEKETNNRSSS